MLCLCWMLRALPLSEKHTSFVKLLEFLNASMKSHVGRTRSRVGEYVTQQCSFHISTMRSSTRNGVAQSQVSVELEVLSLIM